MKKQYSILSMMFVLTLSFLLSSCGQKKDEALVTEFNAKKTDGDKMISTMQDNAKMMMADHVAWGAKLDSAGKAGADMAKIDGFKAQMKKMEDDGKAMGPLSDSIKFYENAKVDNNDQLKAAIAGLDAQNAVCTTGCNNMMDMHKKLGADIMAFLGNANTAAAPTQESSKTGRKTTTTTVDNATGMDMSKHAVKTPAATGTARKGSGSVIKQ